MTADLNVVSVPIFITCVGCGNTVPFFDGIQYVEVPSQKLRGITDPLLVEITGDSMEPYYFHKEIVFVDLGLSPRHGDFVLVSFNGCLMIKRLHFKEGQVCLISTNFLYPTIFVKEYDDWKVLGVCVKKVKSFSELYIEAYNNNI
ncbi:S24 family peptidase [Bacteroidetes/Chlorobi group bacterium Naka2016]|jgi:phage repressor protein C with HTH and peptisase S24 domain|nr:MAG: S24 family peptidase [Bacteroidetes/Chlorobi group bacterium Naka2016]